MPRHANQTSFQPGDKRLQAGSPGRVKQAATLKRQIAEGKRLPPDGSGPNPAKGHPGKTNYNWKPIGTRSINPANGYIKIKVVDDGSAWPYEHRVVAEKMLGRPLERGEVVHHLNGVKTDNRPENLAVMTTSAHSSALDHGRPKCPTCGYRHPPH